MIDTETLASVQTARSSADMSREVTQELLRRRTLAPAVPTFETAAFLSPPRDRTLSWDESPRMSYSDSRPAVTTQVSEPEPKLFLSPSASVTSKTPTSTPERAVTQHPMEPRADAQVERMRGEEPRLLSAEAPIAHSHAAYDIMLGATGPTPQFGLLGEVSGRKVALDLNQTHTISLFGVQGGGKSYTLGSVAEMASMAIPGINCLPEPLATVIFHYSPTMDYKPEFTSMVGANSVEDQVKALRDTYGASPRALRDVVLLVPADKIEERRAEYPDVEVLPLQFSASELKRRIGNS